MEFAWNTQKNKLTDVKGKEIEQERKSNNLKNEDIDRARMLSRPACIDDQSKHSNITIFILSYFFAP